MPGETGPYGVLSWFRKEGERYEKQLKRMIRRSTILFSKRLRGYGTR